LQARLIAAARGAQLMGAALTLAVIGFAAERRTSVNPADPGEPVAD
jgi:hypothetical protein